MMTISESWYLKLKDEFDKEYFKNLKTFLENEYRNNTIYPKEENIFNALNLVKFEDVKVVIIGQDPYHEPNQAHGLSFSVEKDVVIPPSLQNIYKELQSDLGCRISKSGNLTKWAKQGVLLLNTVLTVRKSFANSHKDKGWEEFTQRIIQVLNDRKDPIIFILWGNCAKSLEKFITNSQHKIIKSAHPSPLSCYNGFFGSKPFSRTNAYLKEFGKKEIDWQIEN